MHVALAWGWRLLCCRTIVGTIDRISLSNHCLPHTATVPPALNTTPTCLVVSLIKETELSNLNLVCVALRCQSWQIMNYAIPPSLKRWAETNKFILFRTTGWTQSTACDRRVLSSLIMSLWLRQTLFCKVGVTLICVGPEAVPLALC